MSHRPLPARLAAAALAPAPVTALVLALVLVAGAAGAARPRVPAVPELSRSKAVGAPARGRLERGAKLAEDGPLHFKWGTPAGERWGTEELVRMVQRAAVKVRRQTGGGSLTVGDLSREDGGPMRPHLSHRNGRDIDLGFYLLDGRGRSVRARRFYEVRAEGTAGRSLRFDDRRNWELVAAMVTDPEVEVSDILVAEHVERRLLAEARRQRAPRWLYDRARLAMYQPRSGGVHDDHFHVRIRCPVDDVPACED